MSVETRQDVLDECYIIHDNYKDIVHARFNESIFLSSVDAEHIRKSSKYIQQMCANPVMDPASLGVLTLPISELSSIKEKIDATDESLTFPDPKSLETDYEEVFEKVEWAQENKYIYADEKNTLMKELFNFRIDAENYFFPYYVEKKLYSNEETPAISIFRDCQNLDLYKNTVSQIQKFSIEYSGKPVKLSDKFNSFIIYKTNEEGADINYESFIDESIDLIKECNDLADPNMFEYFTLESNIDDYDWRRQR